MPLLSEIPSISQQILLANILQKTILFPNMLINSPPSLRNGCYIMPNKLFPIASLLPLPLRSIVYNIDIINSFAQVTLIQKYVNDGQQFLQVEYFFPCEIGRCVYKFVASFDRKRIQGVVKEKEEAKAEYVSAMKEGRQAAYADFTSKNNEMNFKIGNIPPKTQVIIELSYLQQLKVSCNTFYRLELLTACLPKYLTSLSLENLIRSFRKMYKVGEESFYWDFKVKVKSSRRIVSYLSSSHTLVSCDDAVNENPLQIALTLADGQTPNKDFVFIYTIEDFHLPSLVFGRTDNSSTAMLSFIPKLSELDIPDAQRATLEGINIESDIVSAKGEYIFLLDCSGSMSGSKMKKACEALILFVKSLPTNTYFNVICFGSTYSSLFNQSMRYDNQSVQKAVTTITKLKANLGGTNIYNPLNHILQSKLILGYSKQIYLLTDGEVDHMENVIQLIACNTNYARVHCIGFGSDVQRELIINGAKQGKGLYVFIGNRENCSAKIIKLLTDTLSPVIDNMKFEFDESLVQSVIPNPNCLPYILKNQIVNFYVTFKGQLTKTTEFKLSYYDSLNKHPFASSLSLDPTTQSESVVDKMARFKQIEVLQACEQNNQQIKNRMLYAKPISLKEEIVLLSVKHQILSKHTAFISVQQQLVDGRYQYLQNVGSNKMQFGENYLTNLDEPNRKLAQSYGLLDKGSGSHCGRGRGRGSAVNLAQKQPDIQFLQHKSFHCMNNMSMPMYASQPDNFWDSMTVNNLSAMDTAMKTIISQERYRRSRSRSVERRRNIRKKAKLSTQRQKSLKRNNKSKRIDHKHKKQRSSSSSSSSSKDVVLTHQKAKQIEQKQHQQPTVQISYLISSQQADGSWKDPQLLSLLYQQSSKINEITVLMSSQSNQVATITYLIAKWIQKHYPQAEYALIVRKALSYVKSVGNIEIIKQRYINCV